MNQIIEIENAIIGKNKPCFIIGEIGSNHNLDKNTVKKLIDACADSGFDAVKFQIYDAEAAFSKNEMTTDVKLDHLYGIKPWWEVARDVILMPRDSFFGKIYQLYHRLHGFKIKLFKKEDLLKWLKKTNLNIVGYNKVSLFSIFCKLSIKK